MAKHLCGLNLDEQQKVVIGDINSRIMHETIRRTSDMRAVQIELKEVLNEDLLDMEAAEAKVQQLEMMRTGLFLFHIRAMADIRTRLTPSQRMELRKSLNAGPLMGGMGAMTFLNVWSQRATGRHTAGNQCGSAC